MNVGAGEGCGVGEGGVVGDAHGVADGVDGVVDVAAAASGAVLLRAPWLQDAAPTTTTRAKTNGAGDVLSLICASLAGAGGRRDGFGPGRRPGAIIRRVHRGG